MSDTESVVLAASMFAIAAAYMPTLIRAIWQR
jgi:hypothetical protein